MRHRGGEKLAFFSTPFFLHVSVYKQINNHDFFFFRGLLLFKNTAQKNTHKKKIGFHTVCKPSKEIFI